MPPSTIKMFPASPSGTTLGTPRGRSSGGGGAELEARVQAKLFSEKRASVLALFADFDAQGDGCIAYEEFGMALQLLGLDYSSGPAAQALQRSTLTSADRLSVRVDYRRFFELVQRSRAGSRAGSGAVAAAAGAALTEGERLRVTRALGRADRAGKGRLSSYDFTKALQQSGLSRDRVSQLVKQATGEANSSVFAGNVDCDAFLANLAGESAGEEPLRTPVRASPVRQLAPASERPQPPPADADSVSELTSHMRSGLSAGDALDMQVDLQRLRLERQREHIIAKQLAEDEKEIEQRIAAEIQQLEQHMSSVKSEALGVVELSDATAVLAAQVKEGMQACRAAMGSHKNAMQAVMGSVAQKLQDADGERSTFPATQQHIEVLEQEVEQLRADRDELSARLHSEGGASKARTGRWQTDWLEKKLANAEFVHGDRISGLEDELELMGVRHAEALRHIDGLEAQLERADKLQTACAARGGAAPAASPADQAELSRTVRDLEVLQAKIEKLRRWGADSEVADAKVLEDLRSEKELLEEELLNSEQILTAERRLRKGQIDSSNEENSKLRRQLQGQQGGSGSAH